MSISQDNLLIASDAMRSLDKLFGSNEVSCLPIRVSYGEGPPAYTNADGIWINESVIEREPHNAHVYLAHEIMHHVVSEPQVNNKFDAYTVNIGEDYVINYQIKRLFGLDVRNVFHKGIFNSKIGSKPLLEACEIVSQKTGNSIVACGCRGIPHPRILSLAMQIKRKYHFGDTQAAVFLDEMDNRDFLSALDDNYKELVEKNDLPVDTRHLLRSLWGSAYLDKPAPAVPHGYLTPEQAITFGWDNSRIRDVTVGDAELSLLSAAEFINVLANHLPILMGKQGSTSHRIRVLSGKLSLLSKKRRVPVRKIAKIQKLIDKSEVRLEKLTKKIEENRIVRTLLEDQENLRTTKVVLKPIVSLKPVVPLNYSGLPSLAVSELRTDLRMLSHVRNQADKLRALKGLENALRNALSAAGGDSDSTPSSSTTDSEDEAGQGNANSPSGSGSGEDQSEGADSTSGDGGGELASRNLSRSNSRISNLLHTFKGMTILEDIVTRMYHFDTQLTSKRSPIPDDTRQATDSTYTFGNDLNKVDPSELVLLNASDATRLLFLSRLANSELLLSVPQRSKRQPVIMMVDASGSMSGAYSTAAGFALSVAKRLHADGRGFALLVFDDIVSNAIVMSDASYAELLTTLLTPSMSGTNFDLVLSTALKLRKDLKWKDTTFVMVTDGGDNVSPGVEAQWSDETTSKDNFVAVLVKGSPNGLGEIPTEVLRVNRGSNELTHILERVGNSIL